MRWMTFVEDSDCGLDVGFEGSLVVEEVWTA